MTLALPSNVSPTPIFDDLDRHFASTLLVDELDAHYATLATTPTGYALTIAAELVDVHDTEIHAHLDVDNAAHSHPVDLALWILVLGAAIGTIIWLHITLTTGAL